jgi:hypothetical protein
MRVRYLLTSLVAASAILLALTGCESLGSEIKSGAPSKSTSTPSPSGTSGSELSRGGSFTLARLSPYANYAFQYTFTEDKATMTLTGEVHSLSDWRLQASSPDVTTYDVDGKGYSTVAGLSTISSTTFATPKGIHHLNGQYIFAEALIGMTHVTQERVRKGGSCTIAGQSGTTYNFETPSNSYFSIGDQACIASNGALLAFAQGVTGGTSAASLNLNGANEVFQVTAVGGIPPITAP